MSAPMRLVLATANPDKAAEITALLTARLPLEGTPADLVLVPRPQGVPEVEETGETLLDNARLKAEALRDATGLAAIADDTGLEVDALGGAPGVYSARFAGPSATYADNVAALLEALERAGASDPGTRRARFTTVALVAFPDGTEVWRSGSVDGSIAPAPRGEQGFGYDPVFVPEEGDGRTFAELTAEEKHALSHRGRAFTALADVLGRFSQPPSPPNQPRGSTGPR
ncbi:MAG: RdgB/HAM1 family non-canonical purine NTP pyrophosphatase [Acidimicrobiales bacterium]